MITESIYKSIQHSINYLEFAYILQHKNKNISFKADSTLFKNVNLCKLYTNRFLEYIKQNIENHYEINEIHLKDFVKKNIETLYNSRDYYEDDSANIEFSNIKTKAAFTSIVRMNTDSMFILMRNDKSSEALFKEFERMFLSEYLKFLPEELEVVTEKRDNRDEYVSFVEETLNEKQFSFSKIYDPIILTKYLNDIKIEYIDYVNEIQDKVNSVNTDTKFDDIRTSMVDLELSLSTDYINKYSWFYDMYRSWLKSIYAGYRSDLKEEIRKRTLIPSPGVQNPQELITENIDAIENYGFKD